jgi:hypothetical protein
MILSLKGEWEECNYTVACELRTLRRLALTSSQIAFRWNC